MGWTELDGWIRWNFIEWTERKGTTPISWKVRRRCSHNKHFTMSSHRDDFNGRSCSLQGHLLCEWMSARRISALKSESEDGTKPQRICRLCRAVAIKLKVVTTQSAKKAIFNLWKALADFFSSALIHYQTKGMGSGRGIQDVQKN